MFTVNRVRQGWDLELGTLSKYPMWLSVRDLITWPIIAAFDILYLQAVGVTNPMLCITPRCSEVECGHLNLLVCYEEDCLPPTNIFFLLNWSDIFQNPLIWCISPANHNTDWKAHPDYLGCVLHLGSFKFSVVVIYPRGSLKENFEKH